MLAPYSDDFRQKAVDAVDRGERKSSIARMFNISHKTLDLCLKHRQSSGSISAVRDTTEGRKD